MATIQIIQSFWSLLSILSIPTQTAVLIEELFLWRLLQPFEQINALSRDKPTMLNWPMLSDIELQLELLRQLLQASETRLSCVDSQSQSSVCVGVAMDGYTSSGGSYGGGMTGLAFEGAVSEADSAELLPERCCPI